MKNFTRTAMLAALTLALSAGTAAAADCLADAAGDTDLECSANDFTISSVTVDAVDANDCGGPTNTFTFDGFLNLPADTNTRYDMGFYISNGTDGALTGESCSLFIVPINATTDIDEDQCGDFDGDPAAYPVSNVTVKCQDEDGNGFFDLSICSSWDNNANTECNGPDDAIPGTGSKCRCSTVNTQVEIPECDTNADCAEDGNECTIAECVGIGGPGADTFGCADTPLDAGEPCQSDGNECTDDECDGDGECVHENNTDPCNDGLFCTENDACSAGACGGSPVDCSDGIECTDDSCDEAGNECDNTPDNGQCEDGDNCTTDVCSVGEGGCVFNFTCGIDICRSPGYWQTHSGYEKSGSTNVGQAVLDAVGGIEVCGQTLTTTSNGGPSYLDGLGLTSSLEGLCMRTRRVKQRQLYRQLTAAGLNCAISGGDCDTILAKYVDVSFSDCSDVCEGNPPVDGPTVGECVANLDCFNNGGQMIDGECVLDLPGNCHDTPLCNEGLGVCPKKTPASSPNACKEARFNGCTIDSCP
jgi:hypothetical protein